MNRTKWIAAGGLILIVGVLVWVNLSKLKGIPTSGAVQGPADAPLVKVVVVQPRNLTQTVVAPGSVEASGQQEIRAPFNTAAVNMLADIGDVITPGQVIATLDSDDLAAQEASQEAAVGRAELALAQLLQQQKLQPIQFAQRLEAAKAQVIQAEQGLAAAIRQADGLTQRLESARANVWAVQGRAESITSQVEVARSGILVAEADYQADPLNSGAQQALAAARQTYADAQVRAAAEARQIGVELARAESAVQEAEQDLHLASGGDTLSVSQSRTQLEVAHLALTAASQEAELGGVRPEQIRASEADLAVARTALKTVRDRLAQSRMAAAEGGLILSVHHKEGQAAQQGQLLYVVGSLDSMVVKARVDEIDVGKLAEGQVLTVKSNAFLQDRFEGKVTRVSAQVTASPAGSFFEVHGTVANADKLLRSGMNAEVNVVTANRTMAKVVGLEAIREEGETAAVLVVRDFKVELRPVSLGLRTQTEVEILAGLESGDQVIVSPFTLIRTLKAQSPVRVEVIDPLAERRD